MDLTPYLKLMVDRNADSLILEAESAPLLRLFNKEKPVGNTPVSTEFFELFLDTRLNEEQKSNL